MKPVVVSVCHDHRHPGFARMANSVEKHGWKSYHIQCPWRGFVTKLVELRDAIPDLSRAGFDSVLFLDAFDVLVFGGQDYLEQHWDCQANAALFSCEKAPWPDADKAVLYPPNPKSPYCYLNSGAYAAKIDYLGDSLLAGCDKADDDQRFYTDKYLAAQEDAKSLKRVPQIERDDGCVVFQSLAHSFAFPDQHWMDNFDIRDGKPWNKVTNTKPIIWHAHGGGASTDYHRFLFDYL